VVGIPGLRVPVGPLQEEYFGELEPLLDAQGFPTSILIYDTKTYPLSRGADLSSQYRSVAMTRILPALERAIRDENEIRRSQGLSPLQTVDLIGYSQGTVLALDLITRLREIRLKLDAFLKIDAAEWEALMKDPEFIQFYNTARDYVAARNARIQLEKEFETNGDLKVLYRSIEDHMHHDYDQFYDHVMGPDTRYPKFAAAVRKNNADASVMKVSVFDNWILYTEFKDLVPIHLRLFSIAGSIFGSPLANSGYYFVKNYPRISNLFVGKAGIDQLRDTRVGSEHQLLLVKMLADIKKMGTAERAYDNAYFIVGANGEKGDGLVPQPSAHMNGHLLSTLDLDALRAGSSGGLTTETLPPFRVTGIHGYHLPRHGIISHRLGISQIEPNSLILSFLTAFLRKDTAALEKLHEEHGVPLRQFMMEFEIPPAHGLDRYKLKVKGHSKGLKVSKPFNNPSTHVLIVMGAFRSADQSDGKIQFAISKDKEKPIEFEAPVLPGKIDFITVKSQ